MVSSRRLRIVLIVVLVVGVIGFAGYQLLNAPERRLYALDALTGQVRWSAALPDDGPAPSTVAIGGDRVFIGVTARRASRWRYTPSPPEMGRSAGISR